MPARPLLLLDCDLERGVGEALFRPWLGAAAIRAVHAPGGDLPERIDGFGAALLTGSAAAVWEGAPWTRALVALTRRLVQAEIPLLGVCFGHQVLAEAMGGPGTVVRRPRPEVGYHALTLDRGDPLFDALPPRFTTFLSHGDEVRPAPAFAVWGRSADCPVQAIRVQGRPAWGVQFHVEYPPSAQRRLLERRQRMHPELDLDPEALFARRPDTAPQARALLGRFLEIAGW